MRNISLTFQQPQVMINGEIYDVRRSDAGILQDLMDIDNRYEDKDMTETANLLEKNREMQGYIDTLLGAGAFDKITASVAVDGFELGIAGTQNLVNTIASAAVEAYSKAIAAKYDD